jgi:uncharacterized protein (TIGR02147 family)
MDQQTSDIVRYTEYRTFLKDRYTTLHEGNPKFSHRHIASRMGGRSAGWFADVISGRQKLKSREVTGIASVFKLSTRETEFLRVWVAMEDAADPEEKMVALEKWMLLKGARREVVERDRFAFFDHWYHIALRELLSFRSFDGDFASLGAALIPPVSAPRVRKALDLLQRLGLIHSQMRGHRPGDLPDLVKAPAGETQHWNHILKSFSKLAIPALDDFSKEERNFSALTLGLSSEGLQKAGEEIAQLRKRLLHIAEKDKGRDRVYQFLFQAFPLSKNSESIGK